MTKLIIDIECTRSVHPATGRDDPSPFNPANRLVTVQWMDVDTQKKAIAAFNHKEQNETDKGDECFNLQHVLNSATEIIGHNIKFDLMWLMECGFTVPEDCVIFDTMVFEYVCNKGSKSSLALKELAIKYELPQKLDILQEYWDKGVNTDEVPLKELTEYALQDLSTTYELYELQRKRYKEEEEVQYMWPAIKLMNEALLVLVEMERNGCYIDSSSLHSVESEYVKELTTLEKEIGKKVNELMGDTPINLASADDMCKLLYGIEVKDKKVWADEFRIGTSERNSVKKRRWPKTYSDSELNKILAKHAEKVYKTKAEQCQECFGAGKVRKVKKNGEEYKRDNICAVCNGVGFTYTKLNKLAGLKLKPISSRYATAAGFAADKKVLEQYLSRESLSSEVKEFLKALQRQSAIKMYLDTFVKGIENNVREDGLLHTNLNQCITATGRLSASNPNLQNQPRDGTFPIRKVFASRFEGGKVLDVDWAGLEMRTAVALSGDKQGLSDIVNKIDFHRFTADTITAKGQPISRQEAKSRTFKPLFAGMSGTEAEVAYYEEFNKKYAGIHEWQEELVQEALDTQQIKSPSGRIYAFPNVYRKQDGNVSGKTQIYNYIIQGFASDLMQCALIEIYKQLKNKKSKLILTVHDSLLIDIYPEEEKIVLDIVKKVLYSINQLLKERFKFETKVPFEFEMKIGPNWGELKKIA